MSEETLTFDSVRGSLLSAFPELLERIWNTLGSYYDLEKGTPEETPDAYPIFEDVVQKLTFELLESGQEEALLIRLFAFFENMANSPDPNVSRDLLGIAIIEPLVYKKPSVQAAWRFMGPISNNVGLVKIFLKTLLSFHLKEFALSFLSFSLFSASTTTARS
jgi:hypothetical protein